MKAPATEGAVTSGRDRNGTLYAVVHGPRGRVKLEVLDPKDPPSAVEGPWPKYSATALPAATPAYRAFRRYGRHVYWGADAAEALRVAGAAAGVSLDAQRLPRGLARYFATVQHAD